MRTKQNALEVELDELAQHLLEPFGATPDVLVVEDLGALAATLPEPEGSGNPESPAWDQTSEIELTAEQMDALLEGRWQP
jgi:hypothetical protein